MLNRTPARMGGPSAADPCGYVELLCFLSTVSHSRTWPWPMVTSGGRGCFPNARECELGRRLGNGESTLPSGTECLHHERPKSQFGGVREGQGRRGTRPAQSLDETRALSTFFSTLGPVPPPVAWVQDSHQNPDCHSSIEASPSLPEARSLPPIPSANPKILPPLWQQQRGMRPTFPLLFLYAF